MKPFYIIHPGIICRIASKQRARLNLRQFSTSTVLSCPHVKARWRCRNGLGAVYHFYTSNVGRSECVSRQANTYTVAAEVAQSQGIL